MAQGALPGFRDFYPEEFAERAWIQETWREVARRHAFVEYDGPPLEPLELYTQKSGDEIVGQLYNFEDKGGRQVALRPEMTPTLARMVAARANALRKPIRWFSMPQLFRYERQQKGRLREHFQLNVDIIGEESVAADAELLAVSIEIMRAFGLTAKDVRARVSDRRLLSHILSVLRVPADAHPRAFGVIDKVERQPRDVSEKKLEEVGMDATAVKRLLDGLSIRSLLELGRHFPEATDDGQSLASLTTYFEYLEQLGVSEWVELDLSIVRGLAYYTGIVFELFDRKGELRAICGGGRYDNLLKAAGGPDLKALGFGMGDVVLGELLRERDLMRPLPAQQLHYWVAESAGGVSARAMKVAAELRRRGARVEYALRDQPLARQIKAATAGNAVAVLILKGENEATLKFLATGDEVQIKLNEMLASNNTLIPIHPPSSVSVS